MIGIYKITSPSNRVYIRQSIDIERRWREHRDLKYNSKLASSFKKHGFENHIFEVLEECETDKLNERERFYQDQFDVLGLKGLNSKLTTTETKSGFLSKEVREKIKLGNKNYLPEVRLKISKSNTGKVKTEEERRKISERMSSRKVNSSTKIKNSIAAKNRIYSKETRDKMSSSQIGKVVTEQHKDNLSRSLAGRSFSAEHKENLRLAWQRRKLNSN